MLLSTNEKQSPGLKQVNRTIRKAKVERKKTFSFGLFGAEQGNDCMILFLIRVQLKELYEGFRETSVINKKQNF